MQFNEHIATAESQLIEAITFLKNANVTDLVLDLRYNGGGYLDLASELGYMIGNTSLTSGQTFEKIVFNDKYPTRNPVTGETLTPTPFLSTTQGWPGQGSAGQPLPRSTSTPSTSSLGPAPARRASPSSTPCAA
jgi:hypothetical protein